MAKCYISDVGADQSHVEAIKIWLAGKGHEVVVNNDLNDDKDDGVYIRIDCRSILVEAAGVRAHFSEGEPIIRRSENQEQPKSMVERVLDLLEKIHGEWS